ncbi:MAG: tetratricopeptide repeat protein, partial [Pseudomonadota bacterium]
MPTITEVFDTAKQHHEAGQLKKAKALYEQVLAALTLHPDALHSLGLIEHDLGRSDTAMYLIREAIAINGAPRYHYSLGNVHYDQGNYAGALACFRAAVSLAPNFARAHAGLGNALFQQGELTGAIAAYRRALSLREDLPGVHANLGLALMDLGELDAAIEHCRRAIALNPDFADGHNNIGLALLLQGRFAEGWIQHAWRWHIRGLRIGEKRFARQPWRGAPLDGAPILLHAEQGAGDTVQFVRYAPLVAARGGRVLVEIQPELKRLIGTVSGVEQVIGRGETLPAFTEHCPLLSLPLAFGTELATIPSQVPYLRPNAAEVAAWNTKFEKLTGRRVGLVWA